MGIPSPTNGHTIAFLHNAASVVNDGKRGWSWFSRKAPVRRGVDDAVADAGARDGSDGASSRAERLPSTLAKAVMRSYHVG